MLFRSALIGFMAWEDWWKDSGLKAVRSEQMLWDAEDESAGTLDLIAEDADGAMVLVAAVCLLTVPLALALNAAMRR